MNKLFLIGRWSKDIEYKAMDSGKALAKSSLAVDDGYGDKKQTSFFDVEMWGKTADNVTNHSGKGRKVLVEGRLKQDTWDKDGQKRSAVRIVAENVIFLDYKDSGKKGDTDPFADDGKPIYDDLPF